ncbi:hypothetical protein E2C01_018651 [Portunus trituberculatus]|uniref:Uncharacterized protein n=1 Tax=Portunus trituberculatus TaxID=210409 RepID=A0A5B7DXN8_PORTR|nr:hypothetical protein [Portunus trituberculatus]
MAYYIPVGVWTHTHGTGHHHYIPLPLLTITHHNTPHHHTTPQHTTPSHYHYHQTPYHTKSPHPVSRSHTCSCTHPHPHPRPPAYPLHQSPSFFRPAPTPPVPLQLRPAPRETILKRIFSGFACVSRCYRDSGCKRRWRRSCEGQMITEHKRIKKSENQDSLHVEMDEE